LWGDLIKNLVYVITSHGTSVALSRLPRSGGDSVSELKQKGPINAPANDVVS